MGASPREMCSGSNPRCTENPCFGSPPRSRPYLVVWANFGVSVSLSAWPPSCSVDWAHKWHWRAAHCRSGVPPGYVEVESNREKHLTMTEKGPKGRGRLALRRNCAIATYISTRTTSDDFHAVTEIALMAIGNGLQNSGARPCQIRPDSSIRL